MSKSFEELFYNNLTTHLSYSILKSLAQNLLSCSLLKPLAPYSNIMFTNKSFLIRLVIGLVLIGSSIVLKVQGWENWKTILLAGLAITALSLLILIVKTMRKK